MTHSPTRRDFLATTATGLAVAGTAPAAEPTPINVVVWDEQQPEQKQAYNNFLGNAIADHLKAQPGLSVRSVGPEDAEKGLSPGVIRGCDVLIWWGHKRQAEVTPQMVAPLIDRIKQGTLALVALHSAHWSTPFVEAMYERTRLDAGRALHRDGARVEIAYVAPPQRYTAPKATDRVTPYTEVRKFPEGPDKATVHLPSCCFPAYRSDGKPSQVRILKPDHPIAKGLPAVFELPRTEMYAEPFHVPDPDDVILEERWATGEWFRSGMVWQIGQGRVFYFRPGHETYPVYKEKPALQVIENAVRWLAASNRQATPGKS